MSKRRGLPGADMPFASFKVDCAGRGRAITATVKPNVTPRRRNAEALARMISPWLKRLKLPKNGFSCSRPCGSNQEECSDAVQRCQGAKITLRDMIASSKEPSALLDFEFRLCTYRGLS